MVKDTAEAWRLKAAQALAGFEVSLETALDTVQFREPKVIRWRCSHGNQQTLVIKVETRKEEVT